MLLATFLTTVFYAATYPFVYKKIMTEVSDNLIALNQIIECVSIIATGSIWNKRSEKLFKFYPVFCIVETIASVLITLLVTINQNIVFYYMLNTIEYAIIVRNIVCGGVKLRSIRYNQEERERFDNNNNSASSAATIIGSIIAMVLNLDFNIMLWLATFGGCIDNIFYIAIYYKSVKNKSLD